VQSDRIETRMLCGDPHIRHFPKATCAGRLSLTERKAGGSPKGRAHVLGQTRFVIPFKHERSVRIALNAIARRMVACTPKLRATLTAVYRTGPKWTTITTHLVLRGRRTKNHSVRCPRRA
jgi:hypothetical protein